MCCRKVNNAPIEYRMIQMLRVLVFQGMGIERSDSWAVDPGLN